MDGQFLFGYGSLVNINSALATIKRNFSYWPAILLDFRRDWSAVESVVIDKHVLCASFLNIIPYPGSYVNGILIQLDDGELERFKLREKNYELYNVSDKLYVRDLQLNDNFECFAFGSVTEKHNCPPLRNYMALVSKGFMSFGDTFYEQYKNTTEIAPLEPVEGDYKFSDADQDSLAHF